MNIISLAKTCERHRLKEKIFARLNFENKTL